MSQEERHQISRRAFLQAVGLAGGAAALAACTPSAAPSASSGSATTPVASSGEQVVNFLWTDSQNTHQPLIKDFETATGIKVNQTQVSYNDLLNKIT
ncbi:MAG: twin-arginine translocation signal domain-containing protein, partial [Caldilineaceae bacterium]|nr:twin-arginine translocation signal domain-containing protein [Caldilineaceae bacterium]